MFGLFEKRSLENPSVPLSDANAWNEFFSFATTITGDSVTEESALGVSAVWQAVNAIAGTISALPLHLFKDSGAGAEKDTANSLYYIVHDRPNEFDTAQAFYKWMVTRLLLSGRATAYISRNRAGRVAALHPLDGSKLRVEQKVRGKTIKRDYIYTLSSQTLVYDSSEVIDIVWFPTADAMGHRNPISMNRDTIALMIAAQKYSGKLFANGGVPPLVLNSPQAPSPQAAARASNDVAEAIKASQATKSQVLLAPAGHRLEAIGLDPSKSQLVELRRFMISETSRIFNIAPALLHDLSTGTYSNTEQQMLSFARQTVSPLVEAIEQEMNAKLFGARNTANYVKFSLNGLLRGDFTARMEGYAKSVQNAIMTPNECRALEELAPLPGGDQLLVQGATVPITMAGQDKTNSQPPAGDNNA